MRRTTAERYHPAGLPRRYHTSSPHRLHHFCRRRTIGAAQKCPQSGEQLETIGIKTPIKLIERLQNRGLVRGFPSNQFRVVSWNLTANLGHECRLAGLRYSLLPPPDVCPPLVRGARLHLSSLLASSRTPFFCLATRCNVRIGSRCFLIRSNAVQRLDLYHSTIIAENVSDVLPYDGLISCFVTLDPQNSL